MYEQLAVTFIVVWQWKGDTLLSRTIVSGWRNSLTHICVNELCHPNTVCLYAEKSGYQLHQFSVTYSYNRLIYWFAETRELALLNGKVCDDGVTEHWRSEGDFVLVKNEPFWHQTRSEEKQELREGQPEKEKTDVWNDSNIVIKLLTIPDNCCRVPLQPYLIIDNRRRLRGWFRGKLSQ